MSLENNERREEKLTIDRDAQIQVVVNNLNEDEDSIDLGRVFHTMKLRWRIYAWVLVLCIVIGACAPLVMYQFTKEPLTVSSVVTLKYNVKGKPVEDLTAPDGTELDLNQITSSYVLQNALDGLTLTAPVSLTNLRSNLVIERILSEESRRQQEVAASMVEDKNNGAYAAVQDLELKYENTFVVSLTNGFGDEDARVKTELPDGELKMLLDRILGSYNDYLVTTYAKVKLLGNSDGSLSTTYTGVRLPDDEISVIDIENNDILESVDQLRTATENLYEYCELNTAQIREYRSWRTGRSLTDWMETLETVRDVNVEYLYSYVYTNSIVKDKGTMLTNYQYQLRNAQTKLDVINENIETVGQILSQYKNDEIYVSMQESDAAKSTKTTTDYYNELIVEQAANYEQAEKLETQIADLQDKIASLDTGATTAENEKANIEEAEAELVNAIDAAHAVYEAISAHMAEIMEQPLFTTYVEHSSALGKTASFLSASMKKMIIGMVAGAVIACGLWLLSGLAPEFRRKKEEEEESETAKAGESDMEEEVAER